MHFVFVQELQYTYAMHFPDLIDGLPEFKGRFTARELAADNCKVLFASYPGGTEIEEHTHDTENVGVITQGVLYLIRNGNTETYRCGDWYHLKPGEPHAARFEEDSSEIEFWFTSTDT